MAKDIVQSLWMGSQLSTMQKLCISSYLNHGHEFHLYTYEKVENAPVGTEIKDAREILPEIGSEFPNYATFSDFFRYKLIYEKGNWWVDMDTVCLKPFAFNSEFVFAAENSRIHDLSALSG